MRLRNRVKQGRVLAYGIIPKLFKKEAEGERIKKPSAFVYKSTMRAWDLMDWGGST